MGLNEVTLAGRIAIVTGAGGGLGRQHALLLARRGAAVVVNDVGGPVDAPGESHSSADQVVQEIRQAGGSAVPSGASVADPDQAVEILEIALREFGRVDILVNNAGIVRDRTFLKMSREEFLSVLDVHLTGAFNVTQPVFRKMREQGYGRIVHTSSTSGLFGNFGQSNYAAAKMGLLGLSRVLAIEGAKFNVSSNVVIPSAATRMTQGLFGQDESLFAPSLVSPMVAFLASDECTFSGDIFKAGGGHLARVFIAETDGIVRRPSEVTIEEIREHIDEIRSTAHYFLPESSEDEYQRVVKMLRQDKRAQGRA